jgi:TIR domain
MAQVSERCGYGIRMTSVPSERFDYDVALSYAREDRAYVEQIAARLRQQDIRIFYDEYAAAELWGDDLYVLLDEVYRKRARFTVVFISRYYASKPWTQHERQSAQARALTNVGPYILPVRLDDSELPGLRPTVAYIDARNTSVERLVGLIEQKLSTAPGIATSQQPLLRSPRTVEQKRELLAQRPEAWEYLLYAGVLWQGRQALEAKWRDHELGYARRTGQHLDDKAALRLLSSAMDDLKACMANLLKMLDPQARERAFGPPGQSGDPTLIEHIAMRFIQVYEEVLDVAAKLRGTGISDHMASVMDAAAHLADTPLSEIRDFIDQVIVETDTIPDRLARGEPITIALTLTLTVDDEAGKRFDVEMDRARKALER